MKYIKLYEDFSNNTEDILEDIKLILLGMGESPNLVDHEKDYCMLYNISNLPSEEELRVANKHLEDIDYAIVYVGKHDGGKILCWIVKLELCKEYSPLPVIINGKFAELEGNTIIEDIQKNILLKMWKDDPIIGTAEKLHTLCIFNYNQVQKVDELFREYLGLDKTKSIVDSILSKKEHHISSGGYNFNITIEDYSMPYDDYLDIFCKILPGGTVTLFTREDQPEMDLEDAEDDEENGWEIKSEIRDCIEDYFYQVLKIRNKTGLKIDAGYNYHSKYIL